MNDERLRWSASLLAATLPVLLAGFVASALANKLSFVAWALGVAAVATFLLQRGWQEGWTRPRLAALLFFLAAGWVSFGALAAHHHEVLDLGFRAFLPDLYHPLWTRPVLTYGLAALLALAGGFLVLEPGRGRHNADDLHREDDLRQEG